MFTQVGQSTRRSPKSCNSQPAPIELVICGGQCVGKWGSTGKEAEGQAKVEGAGVQARPRV